VLSLRQTGNELQKKPYWYLKLPLCCDHNNEIITMMHRITDWSEQVC